MRHQENFGEAHVSAADGVVPHTVTWLVSDHPGRFAATPPHEEGNSPYLNDLLTIAMFGLTARRLEKFPSANRSDPDSLRVH